jgi:hypothetical protein
MGMDQINWPQTLDGSRLGLQPLAVHSKKVRLNSCGHGQNHWPQELDWTLGRTVPICGSMKLAFLIPWSYPQVQKIRPKDRTKWDFCSNRMFLAMVSVKIWRSYHKWIFAKDQILFNIRSVVVCGRFWVFFLARSDGSMNKAQKTTQSRGIRWVKKNVVL